MENVEYPTSGVEGTATVINSSHPLVPRIMTQSPQNLKYLKGLGIMQVILGGLIIILGIAARGYFDQYYWLTKTVAGIWSGLCFLVTGIVIVVFAQRSHNTVLNGFSVAFTIVSAILACIDVVLFGIGLLFYMNCKQYEYPYTFTTYLAEQSYRYRYDNYYNTSRRYSLYISSGIHHSVRYEYTFHCEDHQKAGRIIYGILLVLTIVEVAAAIVAVILCCKASRKCCVPIESSGTIIRQPQPFASGTEGTVFSSPQQNSNVLQQYNNEPPSYEDVVASTTASPHYNPQQKMMAQEPRWSNI